MTSFGGDRIGRLTRRNLLLLGGGSVLALVCGTASGAATPLSAAEFIELSARLLDKDAASLDGDAAEKFLSNLLATGKGDSLTALAGGTGDDELEQRIVTDWYAGVQATPSGEEVVTYTEALVWNALDYTKPQGWCGGEMGYWALPPSEG